MIVVGAVSAVGSGITAINARNNRIKAEGITTDAETEKNKQQEALNIQKAEYKAMKFENPFSNMENVYEDLTVNQQQAEFQAQQGNQQRANIMQGLKGAAGGSGIAGLAQAMANQGQLQTQKISASIGMQESSNQLAAAKGAGAVQIAERQGDQWLQQVEMNRQATLLGMQMGETSGSNLQSQNAQANQMNAQIAQTQATSDMFGFAAQAAGAGTDAMAAGRKPDPNNPGKDMMGRLIN